MVPSYPFKTYAPLLTTLSLPLPLSHSPILLLNAQPAGHTSFSEDSNPCFSKSNPVVILSDSTSRWTLVQFLNSLLCSCPVTTPALYISHPLICSFPGHCPLQKETTFKIYLSTPFSRPSPPISFQLLSHFTLTPTTLSPHISPF